MEGGWRGMEGMGEGSPAPPIAELWMMDQGEPAATGGATGQHEMGGGMDDGMGHDMVGDMDGEMGGDLGTLGGEWWPDASDSSSWSMGGDGSGRDSDSESRGYSSGSENGMTGGGGRQDGPDLGFGTTTSPSSDSGALDTTSEYGATTSDYGATSDGIGSNQDSWPGFGDSWIAMEPTESESLSSDSHSHEYDVVAPPAVGLVAHAQLAEEAAGGWGVGSDMVTNPAAQLKRQPPAVSNRTNPPKRQRDRVADVSRRSRPSKAQATASGIVSAPPVRTHRIHEPAGPTAVPHRIHDPAGPTAVPGGSMPQGQTLRWEQALDLLNTASQVPRPSQLVLPPGSDQRLFLERPVHKRKKGDDRWVGSGGRKGSTHYWMDNGVGVRKRYGRVTCEASGAPPLKYAHYTRLRRNASLEISSGKDASKAEAGENVVEDKSVALYIVIPEPAPDFESPASAHRASAAKTASIPLPKKKAAGNGRGDRARPSRRAPQDGRPSAMAANASSSAAPAAPVAPPAPVRTAPLAKRALPARVVPAPHVFTATNGDEAALTVQAGPAGRFISFRDAGGIGPDKDRELGAFVRAKHGVKLVSTQGDFAEWHRRKEGEAPFESGDVVGFHNGVISRVIQQRTTMLGVISRMAVIEGSLPPKDVRHLYDTVAYMGVVPVKLSMEPAPDPEDFYTGAVLRPSGYNDGTAILVPRKKLMEEAEQRGVYAGTAAGRVGVLLANDAEGGTELETAPLVPGVRGGHKLVTALVVNPTETVPLPQACWEVWLRRFGDLLWGMIAMMAVVLVLLSLRSIGWISLGQPSLR